MGLTGPKSTPQVEPESEMSWQGEIEMVIVTRKRLENNLYDQIVALAIKYDLERHNIAARPSHH